MKLHWEAVTPEARRALGFLAQQPFMQRFYLAGGTALALQLGHRISYDLDFFSTEDKLGVGTRAQISTALQASGEAQVSTSEDVMLFAKLMGVDISFIYQHHPLLEPVVEVEGIRLASIVDIGLMKLSAIISRGTRRDFIDLYCAREVAPLEKLFDLAPRKYYDRPDLTVMAARALQYFDDAESDPRPLTLLKQVRWSDVKKYCLKGARLLTKRNLGLDIPEE
jgi:predicted nucleotidyltransferase component of viral defense system